MNALIDNLMERIHELQQENKRLKNENTKQKETIERLGSAFAQNRSSGMEITDYGAANQAAGVCSPNCMVGLLLRQANAKSLV